MKDDLDKKRHYAYMDENWEGLAVVGWEEFRNQGRGTLIVFDSIDRSKWNDIGFVPLKAMKADPLLSDFVRFIEEYDPAREVVVIFLRQPDSVTAYRYGRPERGNPPEHHERCKHLMHLGYLN